MAVGTRPLCAAVLCGGEGRRLRKVLRGGPKPMAPVAGVPFLDFVIAYLLRSGVRDIVLCTGYKSDVIEKRYGRGFTGAKLAISREREPLGTAGALKLAGPRIKSDPFLVLNGDSICSADLSRLLRFHIRKKALVSVVLATNTGRRDAGAVMTDRSGRVVNFREKSGGCRGARVNAGIYLLDKRVLALIPECRKYSLEYDLFPGLKGCYGLKSRAGLLDIGVPERYKLAEKTLNSSVFGKFSLRGIRYGGQAKGASADVTGGRIPLGKRRTGHLMRSPPRICVKHGVRQEKRLR